MAYESLKGKRILVVDDDAGFVSWVTRDLRGAGCKVTSARSLRGVVKVLSEAGQPFHLALVDMYLPEVDGGEPARGIGFDVADLLCQRCGETILVAMSQFIEGMPPDRMTRCFARFFRKPFWDEPVEGLLDRVFCDVEGGRKPKPRMFIVHGRDDETKLALKNYLQNTLDLGKPVILHEQRSHGRTVIEKFERVAKPIDLVFVILTPDDKGCLATDPDNEKRRARQNVIFETGYFFAKLQRTSGRVILLHKGDIELPSDISGIVFVDISKGVEAAGEEIRAELSDWL
jgi:CheY-like chemotaxis protein